MGTLSLLYRYTVLTTWVHCPYYTSIQHGYTVLTTQVYNMGTLSLLHRYTTWVHCPYYTGSVLTTWVTIQVCNAKCNLAATRWPGCLCTKQALGACASKLLENGLGTRRRTSYLLAASGVGTRSPTWTTAVERKGAVICTPAYARYPFTAGWTGGGGGRQGKKNEQYSSASGGTRTHDPWIKRTKICTTWPPGPVHGLLYRYTNGYSTQITHPQYPLTDDVNTSSPLQYLHYTVPCTLARTSPGPPSPARPTAGGRAR